MPTPILSFASTKATTTAEKSVAKEFQLYEHNFQATSRIVNEHIQEKSDKKSADAAYLDFILEKAMGDKLGEVNKLQTQLNNREFVQEYSEHILKIVTHSNKRLNRVDQSLAKHYIDIDTSLNRLNVSHSDMLRKMSKLFKQMLDSEDRIVSMKGTNVNIKLPMSLKSAKEGKTFIRGEDFD